jgi:hypothetical protein
MESDAGLRALVGPLAVKLSVTLGVEGEIDGMGMALFDAYPIMRRVSMSLSTARRVKYCGM